MAKKKLIALGLIAIMALGQSGSVFAAEGTYYVSMPTYANGVVSGSCTYKPTGSSSCELQDIIHATGSDGNRDIYYTKYGYGVNVAVANCNVEQKPFYASNEGLRKVNNSYVRIDFKEDTWKPLSVGSIDK